MAQSTTSSIEKNFNNLSQKTEKKLSNLGDRLESRYGDLRERFEDMTEQSAEMVRSHPLRSVLGAAAAGLLIGMVIQARRK